MIVDSTANAFPLKHTKRGPTHHEDHFLGFPHGSSTCVFMFTLLPYGKYVISGWWFGTFLYFSIY